MDQATHNKIVSFIWGIADDVLRDLFKRGKYPDVILPMCVLRRMDAVLEPTKKQVLETKAMLDKARITEQRAALTDAAGQAFYNTSKFTLRDLKSRGSQQQLLADFEDYLNGFSPNVQDILENFKFRNQLPTLSKSDALGTLIGKFLDPEIDLSPTGIDNHAMGTVFEELVRKFNEENNEEAGEHWTPRDAVRLMANLVFLPIEKDIKSWTYLLYDCACGTGGMLTVAEETLSAIAARRHRTLEPRHARHRVQPRQGKRRHLPPRPAPGPFHKLAMTIKKSDLYSSLWASCDELRGGMNANQYYVLFMLFIRYVSDRYPDYDGFERSIVLAKGASFADMVALTSDSDIGNKINTLVVQPLIDKNSRLARSDFTDFNDSDLSRKEDDVCWQFGVSVGLNLNT
jgi:type I restriction-modification system DNA methylase subunit